MTKIKTKIKRFIKKNWIFLTFQFIITVLVIYLLNNTIFLYKSNITFRNLFNYALFKKNFTPNPNIILVKIDENFFKKEKISIQGLHRGFYAKAIKNLHENGAAVIGIDVLFQNKYHFPENDKFGKILNKIFGYYDKLLAKNLSNKDILGTVYIPPDKFIKPDPIFLKNGSKLGHVTSAEFSQFGGLILGIYRPGLDKQNGELIYPLGLETFRTYYHIPLIFSGNFVRYKKGNKIFKIPISKYFNNEFIFLPIYTDIEDWQIKIKSISLYDVIHETDKFKSIDRNDKIVLIGATDPTLNDYKLSYNGLMPGIIFHRNLVYALESQIYNPTHYGFIYILSNTKEKKLILFILILNLIIISLIYFRSQKKNRENNYDLIFYYTIGITIISILISIFILHWSIQNKGYYIFLPLGNILITNSIFLISNLGYSLIFSRRLQKLFENLVNTYIGEQVKNLKISHENINQRISKKENVSIFFSDIAGFTSISEKLTAEETINMINIYLEEMSLIIKKYGGIIDKYIGDAIMAYWRQLYTDNIVLASIENIKALPKVNKRIKNLLGKEIDINIRIGLHFGEVTMGDIGSSLTRFNFTIIGDNVNLASRLEGVNKFYLTNICASETIIKNLQNPDRFLYRKLDKIKVKGKDKPILIYQIFPEIVDHISKSELEIFKNKIKKFEEALNYYFSGKFQTALEKFKYVYQTFNDKTSLIFIERCKLLIKKPPQNWEGIWKFNKK